MSKRQCLSRNDAVENVLWSEDDAASRPFPVTPGLPRANTVGCTTLKPAKAQTIQWEETLALTPALSPEERGAFFERLEPSPFSDLHHAVGSPCKDGRRASAGQLWMRSNCILRAKAGDPLAPAPARVASSLLSTAWIRPRNDQTRMRNELINPPTFRLLTSAATSDS